MSDDYRKMEERKARGYLWTDTQEYFQLQSKAKGLCYDFNHLRPEERESVRQCCRKSSVPSAKTPGWSLL